MRYTLYKQRPGESRNLYYPDGASFFLTKLSEQAGENGPTSLSNRFAGRLGSVSSSYYITVPFSAPENLRVDNLEWGQFYVENERSLSDERYHDEVWTGGATNISYREQVVLGNSWIIAECGREPEGWEGKTQPRPPEFEVDGVFYRYVDPTMDEETTWDVLNDPTPRFRFLVKPPPPELTDWSLRLEYFAENVQCVALQIFDYMGYLLWIPKAGSEGDQPVK